MMDLEEMKNTWQRMSKRMENQEIMTKQLLERMTQEKYVSKMNKIGYSEYVGTLICYIGAAYLIINFTKIDDTLMQLFALIAILLLFILPIISLKSLRAVKSLNISSKTYLEAIEDFGKRKIRFQKLQKLNVTLAFFLMLTMLPVFLVLQGGNIGQIPYFWTAILPIFVLFVLALGWWVLRAYDRVLRETEKMLSDINH